MIATDHSPHTLEEKGCDINGKMVEAAIWDCISGFCGVETNVPLMLTEVNKGRMTLNHYAKVRAKIPPRSGRCIRRRARSASVPMATSRSST